MGSNLARNSIASGVAGLSTALAGVLSTIAVARILGVEGTGTFAFAVWAVTFALLAADLGVPGTLLRYIPASMASKGADSSGPRAVVAYLSKPFLSANFLLVVLLLSYAAWLFWQGTGDPLHFDGRTFHSSPLFWALIAGALLTQALTNFTNACLRGYGRFGLQSTVAVISAIVQIASTIIGAVYFGIAGALAGTIAGYLLSAALAFRLVETGLPIEPELGNRITRYAFEAWCGFIVTAFAWSRMEVYFLERSFGSEAVGLFTAALTFSNITTQGPLLLTGALMPFLARQASDDANGQLRHQYDTIVRLFTLAVAPMCVGLAALADELLPLLFGRDFSAAVPTAMVLLAFSAVTVPASLSTIYLLALERTRFVLAIATVGAILVIISGYSIIPAFGAIGAASARSAVQLFIVIGSVWYAWTRLGSRLQWRGLGKTLLCAVAMGVASYGVVTFIGGLSGIAAAISVGTAVYGGLIRASGALTVSDVAVIERAAASLPRPVHSIASATARLLVAGSNRS